MALEDAAEDRKQILVVDDEGFTRGLIAHQLEIAGYAVVEADAAQSALAAIVKSLPDLVLLDVMLPGIDGFEMCRKLRRNWRTRQLPVVLMTGLDDDASINRAYECGATDFITKPIKPTLLVHRMRYLLRASEGLQQLVHYQETLARAQRLARLGSWHWELESGRMQRTEEYWHIFGLKAGDASTAPFALMGQIYSADRDLWRDAIERAATAGRPYQIDYRVELPDGRMRTVVEQAHPVLDERGNIHAVEGFTQDITERVIAEDRIRFLATHDRLTGMLNRQGFADSLAGLLRHAAQDGDNVAVCFLDIDRFKRIVDSFGHNESDELLREVASRLNDSVSMIASSEAQERHPLLGRYGADEFALTFAYRNRDEVALFADGLLERIRQPMQMMGREIILTASLGVALYPVHSENSDLLIEYADVAMVAAREAGRDTCRFYEQGVEKRGAGKSQVSLETELRHALERDELRPFYQAKVDISDGSIVGAEVLLRWQHTERGLVAPNDFIPLAEESGLIVPITEWLMQATLLQAKEWMGAGLKVGKLAVNLSGESFRSRDLLAAIDHALLSSGLSSDLLQLEVTESMLMHNLDQALRILHAIRERGVTLSLDDFGTGYSSLAYLKRFPVCELKIDRAFIRDVTTDHNDAAITSAIISMAQTLSLGVVAEGVEKAEHAEFLLARGCRIVQGFLYTKPVPAEDFARQMQAGKFVLEKAV